MEFFKTFTNPFRGAIYVIKDSIFKFISFVSFFYIQEIYTEWQSIVDDEVHHSGDRDQTIKGNQNDMLIHFYH